MRAHHYVTLAGSLLVRTCGESVRDSDGAEEGLRGRGSGQGSCDFSTAHPSPSDCPPGPPLILTPHLRAGRVPEARAASRVEPICDVTSYSGFFTVDERHNSNLFFWFFPAAARGARAPVVLWLNGGPGMSSMFGLFLENGPFSVGADGRLVPREWAWASSHSVLYIDSPAGTGYSFTDPGGYVTDSSEAGAGLYEALVQFYTMFPEVAGDELYLAGQSYAGKYLPAVGLLIHERNPDARVKVNLKGFAIGNTYLTDPASMMGYGDHLYQIGLVDAAGRRIFETAEARIIESVESARWRAAAQLFGALMIGRADVTVFAQLTGFSSFYNFLLEDDEATEGARRMEQFLSRNSTLRALHAGERGSFAFATVSREVQRHMVDDLMKSAKPWIETLLEHYRVLYYSGQLDVIEPFSITESFVSNLSWSGAQAFKCAQRSKWYVDGNLAGYANSGGNLTLLLVRNAGHRVPTDQPAWALDMISKFTRNRPF